MTKYGITLTHNMYRKITPRDLEWDLVLVADSLNDLRVQASSRFKEELARPLTRELPIAVHELELDEKLPILQADQAMRCAWEAWKRDHEGNIFDHTPSPYDRYMNADTKEWLQTEFDSIMRQLHARMELTAASLGYYRLVKTETMSLAEFVA